MYPTLQVGDRILVWKLGLFGGIHRGDIVVFGRPPADTSLSAVNDLVKRVVGMPGETISSKGDNIYINGKEIAQPWLPKLTGGCYEPALDIPKTHIPANDYYVMGDCRGDSEDSRYFGPIAKSLIVGKVFVVVWRNGHPDVHFL
jgi:signal peptidase I